MTRPSWRLLGALAALATCTVVLVARPYADAADGAKRPGLVMSQPVKTGLDPRPGAPNPIKIGRSFRLGSFTVLRGWRLDEERGAGVGLKDLTVHNDGRGNEPLAITLKLHANPDRLVASIDCVTYALAPGDIARATCTRTSDAPHRWDYATVENSE
jgi:hypothetical protein